MPPKDITLPNDSGKSDLYRIERNANSPRVSTPTRWSNPKMDAAVELDDKGMTLRGPVHPQRASDPVPSGTFRDPQVLREMILKTLRKKVNK